MSQHPTNTNCNPSGYKETIIVLGIGNVLWADEGFGVRCVEGLHMRYQFNPEIELIDGGTQGLILLEHVERADKLVILDAIDYGLEAGTLLRVENDEVPKFLGAKKMSLHQTGFQEVLQLAQLKDNFPKELILLGCQPEYLEDYGGSLRPVVKQAMEQAILQCLDILKDWGVTAKAKSDVDAADPQSDRIVSASLALDVYESERPSAELACRIGDERLLNPLGS